MSTPQDKLFANLTHQLHRDLPREPLTRVVNLAAIALGILRSKSLQVGQILPALPLAVRGRDAVALLRPLYRALDGDEDGAASAT